MNMRPPTFNYPDFKIKMSLSGVCFSISSFVLRLFTAEKVIGTSHSMRRHYTFFGKDFNTLILQKDYLS